MWKRTQPEDNSRFESVKCPVCTGIFGRRDLEKIYIAHCDECKATFTWHPNDEKPSVIMDKDIPKERRYCDKNGCYCRS